MSLSFGHTEFLLPPSALHRRAIPSRQHYRARKRRRLKSLTVHNQLPFDNIFDSLLSHLPSASSLNYITPTLGLASGLALLLYSSSPKSLLKRKTTENLDSDIGEWILLTSPTPFNLFVRLRCPSICFPESKFVEDVNERLVKEDMHYVSLNCGRMIQPVKSDGNDDESMVYQRICVCTEDGGVLSLDWPAKLDLEEECGLDTTVLIVPGTAEGSNERKIRVFVRDSLKRGLFPVVMNPRGCAGSPVTTPRLFTAADSDDISTAVQYINKKRPWTTIVGVGWGYGANMLTKYLAELEESTPLTAATCIDNPFDLEEAMRSAVYHTDYDQRHADGLIKILECNKEIFQGRGKGFDVEKALSASSTREFESAISMVSYGFDTIEDFYAQYSTRDVVAKVKIPVLFIQNDDKRVPLFSIPRSAIAENPYTSLLLCAYSPSNKIIDDALMFSWCQHLILEWLTAVELGLLKGRHPLLKDIDVTIKPSKDLELVESRGPSKRARIDTLLDFTNENSTHPPLNMFQASDPITSFQSRYFKDLGEPPFPAKGLQRVVNDLEKQTGGNVNTIVEEGTNSSDDERGQVLQAAQVVLNLLDMTMPDTLSDEQKKRVVNAVGQGETLIKALEDAVPEDVRGKLTTAVSEILQNHLRFDKLISLGQISSVTSGLNFKVRPVKTNDEENVHSQDQKKTIHNSGDGSDKVDHSYDKRPGVMELEKMSSEISQRPDDTDMHQHTSNIGQEGSDLGKMNMNDVGSSFEEEQLSDGENVPEINANNETSSIVEGTSGAGNTIAEVERENHKGELDFMEENNEKKINLSNDQHKMSEADSTKDESSARSPTSEARLTENEAENKQREEAKCTVPVPSQDTGDSPRFSVSQALDALTGFDDSTQVAVNSVFHVIEGMIDQLEAKKENENEMNNENSTNEVTGVDEVKDLSERSVCKPRLMENVHKSARTLSRNLDGETLLDDSAGSGYQSKQHHDAHREENSISSHTKNTRSQLVSENETSIVSAPGQLSADNSLKCTNSSSENVPSYISPVSSEDPLYEEYLKTYLHFKTRNAKSRDMNKWSALYLDYIPEEDQWKFLDQTKENSTSVDEYANHTYGFRDDQTKTSSRSKDTDNIVEPSFVKSDSGTSHDQNEDLKEMCIVNDNTKFDDTEFEDSKTAIKYIILECLNIEIIRRARAADMEELALKLARETEFVANAVSMVSGQAKLHTYNGNGNRSEKLGTLNGEIIIKTISLALQNTQYLRRVLPVGVVVGAILSALKKFFNVATSIGNNEKHLTLDQVDKSTKIVVQVGEKEKGERLLRKRENQDNIISPNSEDEDIIDLGASKNNRVMVGAVTAALGASALLAHQPNTGTEGTSTELLKEKANSKEPPELDEILEKSQNNIVTSLAEKAMSVASPVVPMKEDGEVDHERLVTMLAELGHKGGLLKLVGKLALLWGGIRGAMSLTEKLLIFLRIAERPLFQRIFGFVFMVLLLWSPIILPLLPILMQSWTTQKPFKIVEFACISGLYVCSMIMVTLWGKKIRQYEDPLLQYGVDLTSVPKNFLKGLIGGATLVILIHAVNSSLGCAQLSWPNTLSSSFSEPVALIKSYGRMLTLIVRGVATATGVSVVEELIFRSWLPQEIDADFGYHCGIVISGLLFALLQRSAWEIPGLWLLSLSLSGARERSSGSLSLPIGLRAGILASNFILKSGKFLTYQQQHNSPIWVTGGNPFQPFSGVVGLAFTLGLAVVLYPRQQSLDRKKTTRVIRD